MAKGGLKDCDVRERREGSCSSGRLLSTVDSEKKIAVNVGNLYRYAMYTGKIDNFCKEDKNLL